MEPAMATAVVAESRYDPRCDAVETLDARLTELVRSGAPLRRALARIAGEVVRRRAWDPLGFVRPADYARERPGLSARELHDLARVDARLLRLPAIDRALATGRLGWTQARLLCRVATPEDEERWLEAARGLSAEALAREVRAIDVRALEAGGEEQAEDEEREVLRVRAPPRVRTKWGEVKRTMRRVTGEWLPTDACVELTVAEVLSAIRLEKGPEEPPSLARRVRSNAAAPIPALASPPAAPAAPSPFVLALVEKTRRGASTRARRAALPRGGARARAPRTARPPAPRLRGASRSSCARLPEPRRLRPGAPRDVGEEGPGPAPARASVSSGPGAGRGVASGAPHGVAGAGPPAAHCA
jgi:hypothetical protein